MHMLNLFTLLIVCLLSLQCKFQENTDFLFVLLTAVSQVMRRMPNI